MATLENVNAELAQRIQGMQNEAGQRGLIMVITTGWRSMDEQWRLYNEMIDAQKKYGRRWQKYAALAAYPGTSHHGCTPSMAVDLACTDPSRKNKNTHGDLASKWGLARTVSTEYWHLELRPGREPLPDPVDRGDEDMSAELTIVYEDRTKTIADASGGVFNAGTTFYGSMYDLKPEQKQGVTSVRAITAVNPNDSEAGYTLWSQSGNRYTFNAELWKSLGH